MPSRLGAILGEQQAVIALLLARARAASGELSAIRSLARVVYAHIAVIEFVVLPVIASDSAGAKVDGLAKAVAAQTAQLVTHQPAALESLDLLGTTLGLFFASEAELLGAMLHDGAEVDADLLNRAEDAFLTYVAGPDRSGTSEVADTP